MALSTSPAATSERILVEDTISPSTSISGTTRDSNSSREAEHLRIALRLGAEAKVLPHGDPLGAQGVDQDAAAEVLRRDGGEASVERDHDQLVDAQALDHVALDLEGHDQLRGRLWVKDAQRVGLERQDGVGTIDHLPVADMDAVEGADRDVPRSAFGFRESGDLDAHLGRRASASAAGGIARPPPPRTAPRRFAAGSPRTRRRDRRRGSARKCLTSTRSRIPLGLPSRHRWSKRYTVTSRSGSSTFSPRRASRRRARRQP